MGKRITIALSKTIPIGRRVNEAGSRVRDWIRSLEAPDRISAYGLRSRGFEKHKGEYLYFYEIQEGIIPKGKIRMGERSAEGP